jgi:hypothetical protein
VVEVIIRQYLFYGIHMNAQGLADLFKHFLNSRLSSAAAFGATAGYLTLAHLTTVPAPPVTFAWLGWLVMIFTGIQFAWWTVSAAPGTITAIYAGLIRNLPIRFNKLSKAEKFVLQYLSEQETLLASLYDIAKHPGLPEPADSRVAAQSLVKRGLVASLKADRVMVTTKGARFLVENRHQPGFEPSKRPSNRGSWMG